MEKTFDVCFDGYWREPNIGGIPSESGVYCVYSCIYNKTEGTVSIHKLLYIGESEDVNNRIKNHEKWDDWKKELNKNEVICISFGSVNSNIRNRVEAALIFKHKPPVNTDFVNEFPFDKTTINTGGKNKKLETKFTVERTE